MPLFELKCRSCQFVFDDFSPYLDPTQSEDFGKCPKCQKKTYERLVSRFRIGGQGDLREMTMHGCHDAHVPHEGHDHVHDHSDEGAKPIPPKHEE